MAYQLTKLTPMLETPQIEKTINFYVSTLGFTVESHLPEMGWVSLKYGHIEIMFSLPNQRRKMPAPIMSGSLYIACNNVDEIWEQLEDKCLVSYPIENFAYGMREFAIYDNNGYLLQFGQEIG